MPAISENQEFDSGVYSTFLIGALVAGLTALFLTGCATVASHSPSSHSPSLHLSLSPSRLSHSPSSSAPSLDQAKSKINQNQFTLTESPELAATEKHAAVYNVPNSMRPEGKIEIVSKGIESIRTHKSENELPALHIQLIVTNQHALQEMSGTWMLDARSQRLRLRSDLLLRPSLVEAEAIALPIIEVNAGQTETIDLYYAVPKQLHASPSLPGFELEWQVQTPQRLLSRVTKFNQELKNQSVAEVYPFDRPFDRPGRAVDYPAMDAALAPGTIGLPPAGQRDLREAPAGDSTWWADPFTEFPFPWRDMVY